MPLPQTNTIQAITDDLNTNHASPLGGRWEMIEGNFALTAVSVRTPVAAVLSEPTFNPQSGVIVKVFLHTVTGEIRAFLAKMLDGDGRQIP